MPLQPSRTSPRVGIAGTRTAILSLLGVLAACSLAGTPPAAPEPVRNLLGAPPAIAPAAPGTQVLPDPDAAGVTATLVAGSAAGSVCLGPVRIPAGTSLLRFTAAIMLTGDPSCEISAVFTTAGEPQAPAQLTFSRYAAQRPGVFQDLYIAAPPAAESVQLEFHLTRAAGVETSLRLRYPCLTVVPSGTATPLPPTGGAVFRHSFSHPDGRAGLVQGAPAPYPAWSCVTPTAVGKTGPGLLAEQPQDAAAFVLPAQQVMVRGVVCFWLQPMWGPGDARPSDMLKLTQGKGAILVRKNHGWSFLFVLWDADGKTQSVSCDLKNLAQGQWTKVEAAWDTEKGLRLSLNGVTVATKAGNWPAPPPDPLGLRLGQSDYDKPERAPYVLDEVEIRVEPMLGGL